LLPLAVAAWAQCVGASQMTAEQQVCCAAMGHDCGATAKKQGCCSSEAPRVDAASAAKRISISTPQFSVIQLAAIDIEWPAAPVSHAFSFDQIAASPPGPPTYLLISTLRI
jgi:hypothetical protein